MSDSFPKTFYIIVDLPALSSPTNMMSNPSVFEGEIPIFSVEFALLRF